MTEYAGPDLDPSVPPSGTGCAECEEGGGWWVHLRRCAACGHVGCCDTSPEQHATRHFAETGHPVVQSFEPGEDWFWDYARDVAASGRRWRLRRADLRTQEPPAPRERVPANWKDLLN